MQPYFLPYIGYFQLIHAADVFVVYDNIEYTRKGWINRNRILVNGKDEFITLPLKKDSDFLDVMDRRLADDFEQTSVKILRQVKELYRKAPYVDEVYPLFERIMKFPDKNLFNFIHHSLDIVCSHLAITTPFKVSSTLPIDHQLKGEDKVLAIARGQQATMYINAIGGMELYSAERFASQGMELKFIKSEPISYRQFGNEFVPWLSILDVMMFNTKQDIQKYLNAYTLI